MAAELKPYPAYRDSGAAWLGTLPAHWDTAAVRRYCRVFAGATPDRAVPEYWKDGTIPWLASGDVNLRRVVGARQYITEAGHAASSTKWIRPGSLVLALAGQGRTKGMVATVECRTTCNQSLAAIEPSFRISVPDFLAYYLESRYLDIRSLVGDGLRDGLNLEHIRAIPTPVPPISEQVAIVRFLDHADRRIRRYIRATEKLIALLEEQKQAVVHQAVTGKIDVRTGRPYPTYKPAGVEWLEEIPAHWETRAFARCAVEMADYRGATPVKTEAGVFLVTAKNIRRGWIDYDTSKEFVAEDDYASIMRRGFPQRGDLLLTTEAPLGHAALVDREDIALAQRVIRFRLSPQVLLPQFSLCSVLDRYFQCQLLRRGTGSTAMGIKASKLPQLKILCPPVDEQEAIVAQVSRYSRRIDEHRVLARREVGLFREFRTQLVGALVTGKADVRFIAAELPKTDTRATEDDVCTVGADGISELGDMGARSGRQMHDHGSSRRGDPLRPVRAGGERAG